MVSAARSAGVVVIGAGQAGLAVSHELSALGVEHLVLERTKVAQSWRGRWDSFTLVTPNWSLRLPGMEYSGPEPDGFLGRDQVVRLLEEYASRLRAPVVEGVPVTGLTRGAGELIQLRTPIGDAAVRAVVVCNGAFQRPFRPSIAGDFPSAVRVLEAGEYRRPGDIAPGRVVIVGSGQTGCQLAEELTLAGRDVILACGRAPWIPRRIEGRDIFGWLADIGFLDTPLAALPGPGARLVSNPQATGRDGGHDLHYRTLQALGVRLAGRLTGVDGGRLRFADDLAASVQFGDDRYADIRALIATASLAAGRKVPELPVPGPLRADPLEEVPLREVSTVILTSGYRPDYASWIDLPVFDTLGFPVTTDGSTIVPGLYFCGVHFLRTRKSGIFLGIGEDARVVAASLAGYLARRGSGRSAAPPPVASAVTRGGVR